MRKKEKVDLIILLIYPIIASLISFVTNSNMFFSVLIFFGIPSIFLTLRAKKYAIKSLIFSFIIGLSLTIIIDYIAHFTRSWLVSSMFNFRLLGYIPMEDLILGILYIYFIIMFYEYFLDKHVTKRYYNKNIKYLIIFLLILITLFFSILIINPSYLNIPYFYLIVGSVMTLLPIIFILLKFPVLISKFFKTTAYFFFLTFAYEVTALKLGWWSFPGNEFIGWVTFLGTTFPFEELIFWIFLSAMAILSWFEFFDDDRK
tara:strand:- start:155 stop:931 length:777 start_codon:yes stop_codon:yes gene_type:complete